MNKPPLKGRWPAERQVGRVDTPQFHFEGDIYGKRLHLLFYAFLRPERKFDSLEELQEEIQRNATETRKFFKNYE